MADPNPSSSAKNLKENIEQISDEVRNRGGRMAREAMDRASEVAEEAGDRASEFYDEASGWFEENSGRAIAAAGALALAGLLGYFIARRGRERSPFDRSI